MEIKELTLHSVHLNRIINIDCYIPEKKSKVKTDLLLINDGQDLPNMNFSDIVQAFHKINNQKHIVYAGIHCSEDRKNEYGTADVLDFAGRGIHSKAYQQSIIEEIIPIIHKTFPLISFKQTGFAGFSLGGLSAIDTVWNHSDLFSFCGVFSGALWWRDKDQNDASFDEKVNRIIHRKIEKEPFIKGLRFFFEAGKLDETADRNNNGIIDAIDDTLDLMRILESKGYRQSYSLEYLELENGKHDIETWGKAFPTFLEWLAKN